MIPYQRHDDVRFNMAPMIDVVFLLIIFFILVATFASAENVPMELPTPENSLAKNAKIVDRVLINCQVENQGDKPGVLYSVGPNRPESLTRISQRLAAAAAANPKLKVIIRADKRLSYENVRAVMEMVADNHVENVNLVAHVGGGES